MNFIAELKRRNVFKVAAAYLIVSWLLLQVSDTLVPALHLPDWFHSGVAFVLMMGFPVAMIFAWAFELTPEGLKKEKEVDRSESISNKTGQKLNYAIISLLMIALLYFSWDKYSVNLQQNTEPTQTAEQIAPAEQPQKQKPDRKSIAVIPFRNRSANEENAEFFSDGVHDELLTNLSRIAELKVISRTSVMSYRDTEKNIKQIARELGVATILEGGVQRAGDSIRINVQLIDAASDEHLWAKIYDRQLTAENIFAIQTEIAQAIANALEATLSPQEQTILASTPTTSLEAYDNYLMATQLYIRGNWQNLWDARSYLSKAIELDPGFAKAFVLLAKTYQALLHTGAASLQEVSEPWEDAIKSAQALDNNDAATYAVYALFLVTKGETGADEAFQVARELEPANVSIMLMYSQYLRQTFQFDQAFQVLRSARKLDPVSIQVLFGLARIHEGRREFDKALEFYARIRQLDPSNPQGIGPVAGVYFLIGNMVESTRWLFNAIEKDPDDSDTTNFVSRAYMDFGDFERARQWLDWIEQNQNINPMTITNFAMLSTYEGDYDRAMALARQTLENGIANRWGSESTAFRALLVWATHRGEAETALEIIRQTHAELFEPDPNINANNVLSAIDNANLLSMTGQKEDAKILLQAVIAAYEVSYAVATFSSATGKAQALALLGQQQAALIELRHQVDQGWRYFWRWETELNPNFASLHENSEFQEIVEFLRTDMARQFKELQALEASGEIPLPPGVSD